MKGLRIVDSELERTATISAIQKFSLDDGPGIRDTIFLKGCNLKCKWCHNPECISKTREIFYNDKQCISCGTCMEICVKGCHYFKKNDNSTQHIFDRLKCKECSSCVDYCPTGALEIKGRDLTIKDLVDFVYRDVEYFNISGGGVTFSGGECLLQVDFIQAALYYLKQYKINTAIDTAGNVPWSSFLKVINNTDLFLYDIKAISPEIHYQNTNVYNYQIIKNFINLCEYDAKIWVRIPVIPFVNTDKEMEKIVNFLFRYKDAISKIQLMPFHQYGQEKYRLLNQIYFMKDVEVPSSELMLHQVHLFLEKGIHAEIV